jgi:diacylglycerol kinase (ATP)
MKRIVVVFNANSGGADGAVEKEVLDALSALGDVAPVRPPSPETFDSEVSDAASDADLIVTAGGDGTLNLTVNALADRVEEVTFAVVPMGTGNDFARTVGLPLDAVEAARALANSSYREIDVGRASGGGVERLFVNACMGGFPVKMNEAIDADTKKRLGPLAFVVGGAKVLTDIDRSTVVINGESVPDCIAVGVGNGRTSGGGIELWPSADPGDGVLNACALTAASVPKALMMAGRVKLGSHESVDATVTAEASTIEIDANPPVEFNVDGELLGLSTPAIFELAATTRWLAPDASSRVP